MMDSPNSQTLYARVAILGRDAVKQVGVLKNHAARPSLAILSNKHRLPWPSAGFRPLDHSHTDELVSRMAGIDVSDRAYDHLALPGIDPFRLPLAVGAAHEPSLRGVVDNSNFGARCRRIKEQKWESHLSIPLDIEQGFTAPVHLRRFSRQGTSSC
jgi:hypothetical protein